MIATTKNMSPLSKNLFEITMNWLTEENYLHACHQSKTVILQCILKLQTCAYDVKPAIVYSRFNYVGICIVNKQTNKQSGNKYSSWLQNNVFFLFVHKLCRITPQMRFSRRHPHHSHEVFIDFHPAPTLRNFIWASQCSSFRAASSFPIVILNV